MMPPALTVVLAVDGASDRIDDRLDAIARSCQGLDADVLVVHSRDIPIAMPAHPPISATALAAPGDLVPTFWGLGIANARGDVVALTTTQFRVTEGWARELLRPFEADDTVGAGGSVTVSPDAAALTRAVFLIRYSEHMAVPGAPSPAEIAGDNAAYRRAAVLRACPNVADGFWEVDVHRVLRAQGGRIVHVPQAIAEFSPALSLREMFANRVVHGSHFGAYRVQVLRWPRLVAVAVTPLVPMVLLARILGRIRRTGQSLSSAFVLLPAMVTLLGAWAVGEARGALFAARSGEGR